ncbi:Rod shape-determining protein rodA [Methylacidimicrobium sp. AP8]|uniref:rod shape-determining protein RodA n=1 Tax=Methylacidimicrobium sp. AP8 TaxID=2730359 RepID=UPI0018BFD931|nr:rod shape-determining protein RodA [Methylacidimicrobium sp. AP8]CAB4244205.1 Rod shape-determining protein rodA [Methylacidimicrobium sp. AP8]
MGENEHLSFLTKVTRFDWSLPLVAAALAAFGIVVVYSATYSSESQDFRNAAFSQAAWFLIGMAAFFVLSFIDYRVWVKWGWLFFLASLPALAVVLMIGQTVNGAKSWLHFGPISVEPADFTKISFVLLGAWWVDRTNHRGLLFAAPLVAAMLVPMILVLKQPALGSAGVFLPLCFAILFVGGLKMRYVLLGLLGLLGVLAYAYIGVGKLGWDIPGLKPYQMNRIRTFFDPTLDPLGAGWTINQSLIAIGSGGFSGKGYLKGTQNMLGFLPKNISYTDFIFSVVGEEWGFLGGAAVIAGECLLLLLCLRIAFGAREAAGRALAVGIATILFTHIFVNVGMTIKVVPITGIPLPFISYGGTFLITCLAGLGLVESVWIHRKTEDNRPSPDT